MHLMLDSLAIRVKCINEACKSSTNEHTIKCPQIFVAVRELNLWQKMMLSVEMQGIVLGFVFLRLTVKAFVRTQRAL